MSWSTMYLAVLAGMAKPMPAFVPLGDSIATFTPTTRP